MAYTEAEDWVALARQGNEGAWRSLFERDRAWIYRIAYRILLNQEDALEVTQETFVKAFSGLAGLTGDVGWRPWIRTIVVNAAISRTRIQGRVTRLLGKRSGEDCLETLPDSGSDPRDAAAASELAKAFRRELERLRPRQRAIAMLHYEEMLPGREIALTLGMSHDTVRTQLTRIRNALRARLAEFEPPGERP